jgi:hypothetical protein
MAYGDIGITTRAPIHYKVPGSYEQALRSEATGRATYASEMDKFYAALKETEKSRKEWGRQFDVGAKFKEKELREEKRQFGLELGEEQRQFGETLEFKEEELGVTERWRMGQLGLEEERLGLEKEKFGEELAWAKEKFGEELGFMREKWGAEFEWEQEKWGEEFGLKSEEAEFLRGLYTEKLEMQKVELEAQIRLGFESVLGPEAGLTSEYWEVYAREMRAGRVPQTMQEARGEHIDELMRELMGEWG